MAKAKKGLPPICESWRKQAGERMEVKRMGERGPVGIDFQWAKGWDTTGKLKTVPDGPFKGRIMFTSRREAQEIAKRKSDIVGREVRYDP